SIHNNSCRLYCYDIITHTKHTIYSIDIPLSEWWLNIKVDPQEQHCALLAHNFLIIANLTTMHTAEWPLNHYSPQTLALNNDTQLCAIHTHNKANRNNYLQLFALTDTGWQQVITDFLLPLYPSKMSFMKDNYLLLYRYEHYGTTRCLHVRITKNDNNEYEIKTIDSSYGNDYIVNKANNNFFNCTTTDYKNSYLVSHDGS